MATLGLKKPEGTIEVSISTGGERHTFSFLAQQIRGTIPSSQLDAKALRALVLPALSKVFGRVQ